MPRTRLGDLEELLLLAVARLHEQAYGAAIVVFLDEQTGTSVALGAVYPTLDRLEAKGLVRSRVGEPTAIRGGRRRRVYAITARGVAALADAHHVRTTLWRGLPKIFREEPA